MPIYFNLWVFLKSSTITFLFRSTLNTLKNNPDVYLCCEELQETVLSSKTCFILNLFLPITFFYCIFFQNFTWIFPSRLELSKVPLSCDYIIKSSKCTNKKLWEEQSVCSVEQFLLTMPNSYNQSSLEDIQQQQLQQVQTPQCDFPGTVQIVLNQVSMT